MARFRRRRKQRLQWFPPLGVAFTIGDTTDTVGFTTFALNVLADGSVNNQIIPLTFDFGQERLEQFASPVIPTITLSDMMNSAWRLRRAVGKIHATFTPGILDDAVLTGQFNAVPAAYFAAGLMVRNVDTQGTVTNQEVNCLQRDDYTDPWIWRRTWVLGQDAGFVTFGNNTFNPGGGSFATQPIGRATFSDQVAYTQFPKTNAHYGSVVDGPHIDAKTNRIIGPEDRLFLHFTTKALPIQPQAGYVTDSRLTGTFDLRLLGNLQRSTNRRNASR